MTAKASRSWARAQSYFLMVEAGASTDHHAGNAYPRSATPSFVGGARRARRKAAESWSPPISHTLSISASKRSSDLSWSSLVGKRAQATHEGLGGQPYTTSPTRTARAIRRVNSSQGVRKKFPHHGHKKVSGVTRPARLVRHRRPRRRPQEVRRSARTRPDVPIAGAQARLFHGVRSKVCHNCARSVEDVDESPHSLFR
jgi:hypothetical protein